MDNGEGAGAMIAMTFTLRPMRWRDIRSIARWRYPDRYAFYNTSLRPFVAIMLAQSLYRLLSAPIYYTVVDEGGAIVGIFSFLLGSSNTVEVGLGMRPDLTGQGRGVGLAFVLAGLDFARRRFRPARFSLTVATWNQRAMRVYERAGFVPVGVTRRKKLGRVYEALEMTRKA
jgi:ribosomal-protein-alanine N-acetyltransferase